MEPFVELLDGPQKLDIVGMLQVHFLQKGEELSQAALVGINFLQGAFQVKIGRVLAKGRTQALQGLIIFPQLIMAAALLL